jgi:hypothetical protein
MADPGVRFAFRLALALGCTVRELGKRMDAREYWLWQEFAKVEPFGEPVADQRFGTLAAAILAPHGCKTSPGDFFKWGPPEPWDWRVAKAGFVRLEQVAKRQKGIGDGGAEYRERGPCPGDGQYQI